MKRGDRVRLIWTDDPCGIVPGAEGTIVMITEVVASEALPGVPAGSRKAWVEWDDGGRLALIEGYDRFEVIRTGGEP